MNEGATTNGAPGEEDPVPQVPAGDPPEGGVPEVSPLSPKGRYVKGRAREYKTMRFLEAAGYECYRMAGSHSPFDVIALSDKDMILAQVKGGTAAMSELEREKAQLAKAPPNAKKILVKWPDRARFPITEDI